MNYNLAKAKERDEAFTYLSELVGKDAQVKITKVNAGRSLNQNSYLHLILGAFGLEFGYTVEEAKHIYKSVSKDIYFYTKKGIKFSRSSADLDKEEMARSIDRFIRYAAEHGFAIPPADNAERRSLIENEMEKNRRYL